MNKIITMFLLDNKHSPSSPYFKPFVYKPFVYLPDNNKKTLKGKLESKSWTKAYLPKPKGSKGSKKY